jgi:hypothetical protein
MIDQKKIMDMTGCSPEIAAQVEGLIKQGPRRLQQAPTEKLPPDQRRTEIRDHESKEEKMNDQREPIKHFPRCGVLPEFPDEDRRQFDTGAVRSRDADETRYDLITPIGLEALARTYAEGARKYSDLNWERGMPVHDMLNHAIRHIFMYLSGDRSEDHLPHAAWNLLGAIHSEACWPELNRGHLRGPGCTLPVDVEHTK